MEKQALYKKYKKLLWCDLKTDTQRAEFLRSGRAHETGIIAKAIVEDVAEAFEYRALNSGYDDCLSCYSRPCECIDKGYR